MRAWLVRGRSPGIRNSDIFLARIVCINASSPEQSLPTIPSYYLIIPAPFTASAGSVEVDHLQVLNPIVSPVIISTVLLKVKQCGYDRRRGFTADGSESTGGVGLHFLSFFLGGGK